MVRAIIHTSSTVPVTGGHTSTLVPIVMLHITMGASTVVIVIIMMLCQSHDRSTSKQRRQNET